MRKKTILNKEERLAKQSWDGPLVMRERVAEESQYSHSAKQSEPKSAFCL